MCSFLPSAANVRQCLVQVSHSSWQSAQVLAHFAKCSAWLGWGPADCPPEVKTAMATAAAKKKKVRNIVFPLGPLNSFSFRIGNHKLVVQVDDLFGVFDRENLPGSTILLRLAQMAGFPATFAALRRS
jgi:hypothetical protein